MSTVLVVTGASRGLGRAIAKQFAKSKLLSSESNVRALLLARSKDGLEETAQQMQDVWNESVKYDDNQTKSLSIRQEQIDFSDLDTLEDMIIPLFEKEAQAQSQYWSQAKKEFPSVPRSILINCAGTTGFIGKYPSLSDIQQATNLNFTSKVWLSTQFAQHFTNWNGTDISKDVHELSTGEQSTMDYSFPSQCTIVNITSMCAIKPTPTMGLYCATSAGRDIYHQVLAHDCGSNKPSTTTTTNVRILNYAPGSCDTEMQTQLREHDSLDPAVQAYCRSLVDSDEEGGGLVDCEATANELVRRVLEKDAFTNGERVEYVSMSTYKY